MSREQDRLQRLHAALEELADVDARSLVEEARIEARVRVRTMLAEAMAERLLERAEGELGLAGPPPPPPREPGRAAARERSSPPPPAPARAAEEEQGWYVYGIVPGGYEPPMLTGVDGRGAVAVIEQEGLGAVASSVSLAEYGEEALRERLSDVSWLEPNARRHEQVLERLRRDQVSLVPMRLCTIYRSEGSVREMLAREREFLLDALARLEGRTEWGVKMFLRPGGEAFGEPGQQAGVGAPAQGESGPGEAYMRSRRVQDARRTEQQRRLEALREQAYARLSALAAEARLNPLQPPELSDHDGQMLLNGVYLVDDDAAAAFADLVAELQQELAEDGLDVILTGPWPPYNFVNASAESA